ncbi:hypothetical protein BKA67DRAFT_298218 [Truncatella angustata]|uniref:Uncharacterized protein n=1 Tax=Truncatella angustata TaxID=152316 RepID=A0A9P8ZW73_9PEZI|nr:uncharacterized protein BKA67DRAFT_298218 [Truncatella angustata]KAH6652682.1 hypothetical protein BKA67DRAFT_298218 [Truncatella angustata]
MTGTGGAEMITECFLPRIIGTAMPLAPISAMVQVEVALAPPNILPAVQSTRVRSTAWTRRLI